LWISQNATLTRAKKPKEGGFKMDQKNLKEEGLAKKGEEDETDFTDTVNKFNSCVFRLDFVVDFFGHTDCDESLFLSKYSVFGASEILGSIRDDLKSIRDILEHLWLEEQSKKCGRGLGTTPASL
jgi:hypothetical protein